MHNNINCINRNTFRFNRNVRHTKEFIYLINIFSLKYMILKYKNIYLSQIWKNEKHLCIREAFVIIIDVYKRVKLDRAIWFVGGRARRRRNVYSLPFVGIGCVTLQKTVFCSLFIATWIKHGGGAAASGVLNAV